jgi:hypothetical protein
VCWDEPGIRIRILLRLLARAVGVWSDLTRASPLASCIGPLGRGAGVVCHTIQTPKVGVEGDGDPGETPGERGEREPPPDLNGSAGWDVGLRVESAQPSRGWDTSYRGLLG